MLDPILVIAGTTLFVSASITTIKTIVANRKNNSSPKLDKKEKKTKKEEKSLNKEKKAIIEKLKNKLNELEKDNENIDNLIEEKLSSLNLSDELKESLKQELKEKWNTIYNVRKNIIVKNIDMAKKATTIDELKNLEVNDYSAERFINNDKIKTLIFERQNEERMSNLEESQKKSDEEISKIKENQKKSDKKIDRIQATLDSLSEKLDTHVQYTIEELKNLDGAIYAFEERHSELHDTEQKQLKKSFEDLEKKLSDAFDKKLIEITKQFMSNKDFSEFKSSLSETLESNVKLKEETLTKIDSILAKIESAKKSSTKISSEIKSLREKIERRVTKQDVQKLVRASLDERLKVSEKRIKKIEETATKLLQNSEELKKKFNADDKAFIAAVTKIVESHKATIDLDNEETVSKIANEVINCLTITNKKSQ